MLLFTRNRIRQKKGAIQRCIRSPNVALNQGHQSYKEDKPSLVLCVPPMKGGRTERQGAAGNLNAGGFHNKGPQVQKGTVRKNTCAQYQVLLQKQRGERWKEMNPVLIVSAFKGSTASHR